MKLSTGQLDIDHLEKLTTIFHNKVVNNKQDKYNVSQITKVFNEKKTPQELEELFIRDLAIHHLANAGLEVNPHQFMIEFWRYRCFGDKLGAALPRHKDNYGVMLCPINTCIFYIRKDPTLKGGNLNIYGGTTIRTIESNSNRVVCMSGDIEHSITPFEGFGIRDAIVVQFEKSYDKKPILFNLLNTKIYH